jgi:hypothetical protein
MCGFLLFIRGAWEEFSVETGERPSSGGHWWPDQHKKFDAWLAFHFLDGEPLANVRIA